MRSKATVICVFMVGITLASKARADGPPSGSSPFIIALYKGDTAAVVQHLSEGADPNAASPDGIHALNLACDYGDADMAQALLDAGARVDGDPDDPPLGWCAYNGNTAVLRVLIKAGADVNAKGSDGESALDSTRRGGQRENEKILRAHGATVMKPEKKKTSTLLEAIAQYGGCTTVKKLLAEGARTDATDAQGRTALHLAVKASPQDCIPELVAHGADPNAQDTSGDTPLHIIAATAEDRVKGAGRSYPNQVVVGLIDKLIAGGARLDVRNKASLTPLGVAEKARKRAITEKLKVLQVPGRTPLQIATLVLDVDGVKQLLKKGAPPDATDENLNTALHLIAGRLHPYGRGVRDAWAYKYHMEIIEALLASGADLQAKNSAGLTPQQVAEKLRDAHVAEKLRSLDESKKTPPDTAK